ncbi:probable sugar phosphate/phosphate translocator At3g17430 [Solanum stenotomum]|uniref:probable sugar phosphate/phosphate translocator At3g17430 n=1 Tax=Solanum stenotomum TaxID=172797 RepID=UPI0020D047A3|nr:probable sugar phosphate/phosphate translocator At3g17430 [Solanum stenotomum]
MEVSQIQFNFWNFFSNALCALVLNFSIFLVSGRTALLCGVVRYNYFKIKDVRDVQLPVGSVSERRAKELKMEKKSSDLFDEQGLIKDASDKDNFGGYAI